MIGSNDRALPPLEDGRVQAQSPRSTVRLTGRDRRFRQDYTPSPRPKPPPNVKFLLQTVAQGLGIYAYFC